MDPTHSSLEHHPMRELIRLSKSTLDQTDKSAVASVLDNEYLGMGNEVNLFEKKLANYFGRPVVCVSNGTAALHLALQACGIGPGDEVLVQSLTYVASFQAISATGAIPIPCDILQDTYTIDCRDAENRLTTRTKAIMPVHYSGGVGNLDEIYNFAMLHNLRVIEDAAHAFGTTYGNKKVGSFGDISCFSFDGIKNITSGEGGCLVSEDEEIVDCVRNSRLLGVVNDTVSRYNSKRSWDFEVEQQGWRYHMSNIMAALGKSQFQRLDEISLKRQELAIYYDKIFKSIPNVAIINHDYTKVVPHIYPIRLKGITNRETLRKRLLTKGIETGVHYKPNHHLKYYHNSSSTPLHVTDCVYKELLSLPLHLDLDFNDISYITDSLLEEFVY